MLFIRVTIISLAGLSVSTDVARTLDSTSHAFDEVLTIRGDGQDDLDGAGVTDLTLVGRDGVADLTLVERDGVLSDIRAVTGDLAGIVVNCLLIVGGVGALGACGFRFFPAVRTVVVTWTSREGRTRAAQCIAELINVAHGRARNVGLAAQDILRNARQFLTNMGDTGEVMLQATEEARGAGRRRGIGYDPSSFSAAIVRATGDQGEGGTPDIQGPLDQARQH